MITMVPGREGLSEHGIATVRGRIHWQPTISQLYMHALTRGDGALAEGGPLVVDTGIHTGRSPKDKFIVREPESEDRIWWSDVNADISEDSFERLRDKVTARLGEGDVYVVDAFAGADPAHRIAVRVVTESPWHALFAKTLFIDPTPDELEEMEVEALVLHAPSVDADPEEDGTRTQHVHRAPPVALGGADRGHLLRGRDQEVDLHADERPASARGRLPDALLGQHGRRRLRRGVLRPLGHREDDAVRGPGRHLIGDDEHGWGAEGVFNVEGGCYAKVIRLSAEAEPEIYKTTQSFGTVLENVVMDEHGVLDLDDASKTENTRAAYKLEQIANALPAKRAGHPETVVFLTADAFGILPPLARLTRDQALYWFLSGFTAKLAGTEIGVHGAAADVLGLLRGAVPAAAAVGVRADARREARPPRLDGLARQHRLDGRAVRPGAPHADQGDARAPACGAVGRPRGRRVPDRSRVRVRGSGRRSRCPGEPARSPARPGPIRAPTT